MPRRDHGTGQWGHSPATLELVQGLTGPSAGPRPSGPSHRQDITPSRGGAGIDLAKPAFCAGQPARYSTVQLTPFPCRSVPRRNRPAVGAVFRGACAWPGPSVPASRLSRLVCLVWSVLLDGVKSEGHSVLESTCPSTCSQSMRVLLSAPSVSSAMGPAVTGTWVS